MVYFLYIESNIAKFKNEIKEIELLYVDSLKGLRRKNFVFWKQKKTKKLLKWKMCLWQSNTTDKLNKKLVLRYCWAIYIHLTATNITVLVHEFICVWCKRVLQNIKTIWSIRPVSFSERIKYEIRVRNSILYTI